MTRDLSPQDTCVVVSFSGVDKICPHTMADIGGSSSFGSLFFHTSIALEGAVAALQNGVPLCYKGSDRAKRVALTTGAGVAAPKPICRTLPCAQRGWVPPILVRLAQTNCSAERFHRTVKVDLAAPTLCCNRLCARSVPPLKAIAAWVSARRHYWCPLDCHRGSLVVPLAFRRLPFVKLALDLRDHLLDARVVQFGEIRPQTAV
jgi:hypothetical protein